jgi:hypothetical protein
LGWGFAFLSRVIRWPVSHLRLIVQIRNQRS